MDALESLKSLKGPFERAADKHPTLKFMMVGGLRGELGELQHTVLDEPEALDDKAASFLGYTVRDFGDRPVAWLAHYTQGTPAAGERMQRFIDCLYGETTTGGGSTRFLELAASAGRCLWPLRGRVPGVAELVALTGSDPSRLWMHWVLFAAGIHPGLRVETFTRTAVGPIAMTDFACLRDARDPQGVWKFWSKLAKLLPTRPPWCSVLRHGVLAASALAIDAVAENAAPVGRQNTPLITRLDLKHGTLIIDGRLHSLAGDGLRILMAIIEGQGQFVGLTKGQGFTRPDRFIARFPRALRELLEAKRGAGGGYRIDPRHIHPDAIVA